MDAQGAESHGPVNEVGGVLVRERGAHREVRSELMVDAENEFVVVTVLQVLVDGVRRRTGGAAADRDQGRTTGVDLVWLHELVAVEVVPGEAPVRGSERVDPRGVAVGQLSAIAGEGGAQHRLARLIRAHRTCRDGAIHRGSRTRCRRLRTWPREGCSGRRRSPGPRSPGSGRSACRRGSRRLWSGGSS